MDSGISTTSTGWLAGFLNHQHEGGLQIFFTCSPGTLERRSNLTIAYDSNGVEWNNHQLESRTWIETCFLRDDVQLFVVSFFVGFSCGGSPSEWSVGRGRPRSDINSACQGICWCLKGDQGMLPAVEGDAIGKPGEDGHICSKYTRLFERYVW